MPTNSNNYIHDTLQCYDFVQTHFSEVCIKLYNDDRVDDSSSIILTVIDAFIFHLILRKGNINRIKVKDISDSALGILLECQSKQWPPSKLDKLKEFELKCFDSRKEPEDLIPIKPEYWDAFNTHYEKNPDQRLPILTVLKNKQKETAKVRVMERNINIFFSGLADVTCNELFRDIQQQAPRSYCFQGTMDIMIDLESF